MKGKLARFPLLAELIDSDRGTLAEFLTERELDSGSTLFRTHDEAEELYFVTSGALAIKSDGQVVSELGAGEVLGALCLVSVSLRECDAVAIETSQLLCLSRESYLRLRSDQPTLALQLEEAILRSFSSLVRNMLVDARAPDAVDS
ncbi:MAG: cyclic nucleotide-binding domain-containing protein [Myxococcota bacterium]